MTVFKMHITCKQKCDQNVHEMISFAFKWLIVFRSAIERFYMTSSKSNFYTIHSRKLLLSYFLEFHKLSLHPKVWADMKFLSGVTDI